MKKPFCDICEAPVKYSLNKFKVESSKKVLFNKTTQITVTVNTGFKNHPGGDIECPDLCDDHLIEVLHELIDVIKKKKETP